jgi:uncharacterized integral membrane protein
MLRQLDAITHARRTRLQLSTGIVPALLWTVLYTGAVLTVGFTFFFGTKNLPAQVMMTGILSIIVFMGSARYRLDQLSLHRSRSCRH